MNNRELGVVLFLTALVPLMAGGTARANVAAPVRHPAVAGAPGTATTSLEVESERLTITCTEEEEAPRCDFTAVYRIHNPTAQEQSLTAAFYGVRTGGVEVTVDGRKAERGLSDEEVKSLDQAVREVTKLKGEGPGYSLKHYLGAGELVRHGFPLTAGPGRAVEVVTTGKMAPEHTRSRDYGMPTVKTRHLLLSSDYPGDRFDFEYFVAPIRTWASAPEIDVTIRYPAHWRLYLAYSRLEPELQREGNTISMKMKVDPGAQERLMFVAHVPQHRLYNGGFLLGLGSNLDDSGGLRARIGYEIASPEWVMYSLNLDTDFEDEFVVAPMIEAATYGVFYFFPSLGIGAGLPLRLSPDVVVGARLQCTVQWPIVGLVTFFDWYPGLSEGDPERFQSGLMVQIAF